MKINLEKKESISKIHKKKNRMKKNKKLIMIIKTQLKTEKMNKMNNKIIIKNNNKIVICLLLTLNILITLSIFQHMI